MAQKVVRTNRQLLELVRSLNSTPADSGSKREAKLLKIASKIKKYFEEYNERREELRLEHAHVNKDGVLELNEEGGYRFTKEGLKALNKDLTKLLDQEFEFYQFTFSKEGIEDLVFLEGWVEGIEAPVINDEEL